MASKNSEDEYQLLPSKELESLKSEIQQLKTKNYGADEEGKLISSIKELKRSVDNLNKLFDQVNKDIMRDFETKERPEDLLKKLIDQNKTVATVLLNLSSKIDEQSSVNTKKEEPSNNSKDEELNQQEENKSLDNDKTNKSNDFKPDDIPQPDEKKSKSFLRNPFKK